MNPSTVAELKTNVFEIFPRQNPKIRAIFDRQILTWAHELSKSFPWSFLRCHPLDMSELTFPIDLVTVPRIRNEWVAPGWLITEEDQGKYQLDCPIEYDQWETASWWTDSSLPGMACFSDKVWFVKLFEDTGYFRKDLPIVSRDTGFSGKISTETGIPECFYLTTTEEGSFIHFLPVPDKQYLFAIEFQQINPPMYNDPTDGQTHNKFLTFAPRVLELYSMIQVAGYFNETQMKKEFQEDLYGAPARGLKQAINMKTGIIGDLVNDTRKMTTQQNHTLRILKSDKDAVGREGRPGRWRFANRIGYR